jgi:hypothetical protein
MMPGKELTMKFLTDIWKRAQHTMAASTWFEAPERMKNEMRSLGWSFRTVAGGGPNGIHYHNYIYTPEKRVLNGEHPEDFARYAQLRRELADRLYPAS